MSPDVLIYVQNIKMYFLSNGEAMKYFNEDGDLDLILERIGEISQKNFEKNGDPQLTLEQFEKIRQKNMNQNEVYLSYITFGPFSLN